MKDDIYLIINLLFLILGGYIIIIHTSNTGLLVGIYVFVSSYHYLSLKTK